MMRLDCLLQKIRAHNDSYYNINAADNVNQFTERDWFRKVLGGVEGVEENFRFTPLYPTDITSLSLIHHINCQVTIFQVLAITQALR